MISALSSSDPDNYHIVETNLLRWSNFGKLDFLVIFGHCEQPTIRYYSGVFYMQASLLQAVIVFVAYL